MEEPSAVNEEQAARLQELLEERDNLAIVLSACIDEKRALQRDMQRMIDALEYYAAHGNDGGKRARHALGEAE